ncbi:MAG TPA: Asp-tRNA(Asn)/Glu-tRNA(Gln) amidotransferase subunit GatB [Candidatus Acidoferrum sp.]|nr:Asp-tRNA(Asn)/Glu-tRNA(Gln) amidotransferase subunit GatB [Candidatus Acidoferrum sp.]
MTDKKILDQYQPTVGIECHVQLKTKTKLFSGADNDAREAAPNTTVSPICFGLPGTLPVLNAAAVDLAIRAGVALNAEIAKISSFDRKHYFYPDLPKGYQITQLDQPIVGPGFVEVPLKDRTLKIRIIRAHLEEDAGKLTHPEGADYSLVDLNRAGTPLLEIVSEADMHSAEEAKAYVQELYLLMKYADVSDCNLYYGNMRFDVNISAAKKGAAKWGTRVEIKNLNSFRSVERAVEYEFARQVELLEKGGEVVQETRGWNDAAQKTIAQRGKENAHDYRYFPEPDVPPLEISDARIAKIRSEVETRLPAKLRAKLQAVGIRSDNAETLLLADVEVNLGYVPRIVKIADKYGSSQALFAANFLINRDLKERKETTGTREPSGLPSEKQFAEVFEMTSAGELSSNGADALLIALRSDADANAREAAKQQGLIQENDQAALGAMLDEILADPASQKAVADIKAGNTKAIAYLVGQAMKRSGGKANPGLVTQLVMRRLQ